MGDGPFFKTDSDGDGRQEEERERQGLGTVTEKVRIVVSRKAKPQDLGLTKKVEKS